MRLSYEIVPAERIQQAIILVRGQKVMLDQDLAAIYGVETKALNRAVKRNVARFPSDFMFQLTPDEVVALRSHFGTSSWGGRRYQPYVFTENGVAMLSNVLRSTRAIHVNIQIMRTFTRLRGILATHQALRHKIEAMEKKYDSQFHAVFEAIRRLMAPPAREKKEIGFKVKEKSTRYRGWQKEEI